MKIYKITDPKKLKEIADKTKKNTIISTVITLVIIVSITVYLLLSGDKKVPVIPLTLVELLFVVLFSLLIKQVNNLLYKLAKYKYVRLDSASVTIGTSAEFKEGLNFIQKHLFSRVNRFGAHNDKTFYANKIKSLQDKKNAVQIKVSGVVGNVVAIPKEIDNLSEIIEEITRMMRS